MLLHSLLFLFMIKMLVSANYNLVSAKLPYTATINRTITNTNYKTARDTTLKQQNLNPHTQHINQSIAQLEQHPWLCFSSKFWQLVYNMRHILLD